MSREQHTTAVWLSRIHRSGCEHLKLLVGDLTSTIISVTLPTSTELRQHLQDEGALLQALVANYGAGISAAALKDVVDETAALVTETDLSLTGLAFQLCTTIVRAQPPLAAVVHTTVRTCAGSMSFSQVMFAT